MKPHPIQFATHASEQGHYYDQSGRQVVTVIGSKGTPVTPDRRHARKYDLAPGLTTILRLLDKPQLNNWIVKQTVLAALTLPRQAGESDMAFVERVMIDSRAEGKAAAEGGTEIHAAVKAHYNGQQVPEAFADHVAGTVACLDRTFGEQGWQSEQSCTSPLGYGTTIDLYSEVWLGDFKSKDGDLATLQALPTYLEHALQLAAGMQALQPGRFRRGFICYVSRTHPGATHPIEVPRVQLERAWELFQHLLAISFLLPLDNPYRPSWATLP